MMAPSPQDGPSMVYMMGTGSPLPSPSLEGRDTLFTKSLTRGPGHDICIHDGDMILLTEPLTRGPGHVICIHMCRMIV